MDTELVQTVTAATGVVAAGAAAFAARMSRATVERANLAFVWAEMTLDSIDDSTRRLRVQLHSDGPGIALDVRWSLGGPWDPTRTGYRRDQEEVATRATPAIRALRPGFSYPALAVADASNEAEIEASYSATERYIHDEYSEAWWIVVRWSDSAGRRWEFSEATAGRELAQPPGRVRRQPLTWRPWWTRVLPSWWIWTVPPRVERRRRREW